MAPQTGFEPATGHLFFPCYLQAVGVGLPTAMSWARLALLPMKELALIFRIALGGVANRSAARYVVEGTTVGRSARPVHVDRSPNDWRFLLSRK